MTNDKAYFDEALRRATVFDDILKTIKILDDKVNKIDSKVTDNLKYTEKCNSFVTKLEVGDTTPRARNYIEMKCPNCGGTDKIWYDGELFIPKIMAVECKKCHEEYALNYDDKTKSFY